MFWTKDQRRSDRSSKLSTKKNFNWKIEIFAGKIEFMSNITTANENHSKKERHQKSHHFCRWMALTIKITCCINYHYFSITLRCDISLYDMASSSKSWRKYVMKMFYIPIPHQPQQYSEICIHYHRHDDITLFLFSLKQYSENTNSHNHDD